MSQKPKIGIPNVCILLLHAVFINTINLIDFG